jgi:hypothetical protein
MITRVFIVSIYLIDNNDLCEKNNLNKIESEK